MNNASIKDAITAAEASMKKKNYQQALEQWIAIQYEYPTNPVVYNKAAIAAMKLRQFKQAEEFCRQGIENADEPAHWINLAEISMARPDFQEALKRWALVRDMYPTNPVGYNKAAIAAIRLRQFKEAEEFCHQGIENADAPAHWINLAEISMARPDFQEALKRWALVRDMYPTNPVGYNKAAIAAIRLRQFKEAEEFCHQGIENADAPAHRINLAEISMARPDFQEALKRWARVRDMYPTNPAGYDKAAIAAMKLRHFDEAETLCRQGIKNADAPAHRINLAEISMARPDFQEALKRWALVRDMYPTNPVGYNKAAIAATRLRQFKEAEKLCRLGIENADAPAHWINLAEISMAKPNFQEALKRWALVRDMYPKNPVGYNKAAIAATRLRQFKEAEKLCRLGIENADAPAHRINLAEISMARPDFQEALKRWALVRDMYPKNPVGYNKAAIAAMKLRQFKQAEEFCRQGIENADAPAHRINLAEISMAKPDFQEALERWARVRDMYPTNPAGYSRGAVVAMKLRHFDEAETLCRQGIKNADAPAHRINLAEISMAKSDFQEALKRWALVRDMYPKNPVGYNKAAIAAIRLRQFKQAEEFCRQGIENADAPAHRINLAEISMAKPDFQEALERWARVRDMYPTNPAGYSKGAVVAMKLRHFDEAETLCRQGIKNADAPAHRINLAEISMARPDFQEALKRWALVRDMYPANPAGYNRAAVAAMELRNFDEAEKLCCQGLEKACHISLFQSLAENTIRKNGKHRRNIYKKLLNIKQREYKMYHMTKSLTYIANIYSKLIKEYMQKQTTSKWLIFKKYYQKYVNKYTIEYNNLLSYIKNISTTIVSNSGSLKNIQSKIGFYMEVYEANVYVQIVKNISPDKIDIIFPVTEITSDFYTKYSIPDLYKKYTCVTKNKLTDYTIIVSGIPVFNGLDIPTRNYLANNTTVIGVLHGCDVPYGNNVFERFSCILAMSQKQVGADVIPLMGDTQTSQILKTRDQHTRCEFGYTGPYHMGEWLKKKDGDKSALRAELGKQLGVHLPDDKPLVVVLEDEISYTGQIIYTLNKLSKYATVIFKPMFMKRQPLLLEKICKDVLIFKDEAFAPNLLRFAADIILAGFCSGTFISSVMTGIHVIPYYSRIVGKHKSLKKSVPRIWETCIPSYIDPITSPSRTVILFRFNEAQKLFDLCDIQRIKEAILGTNYKKWYSSHLKSIQKEAYGDYILEDAPEKTAAYIRRFAKEGTLGKDCSAVYLKTPHLQ